jgi:hypothetical protein
MKVDPVTLGLIVGVATSAIYFLSRPTRADDLRRRLPVWMRGRGTDDPFFPFRIWRWNVLPSHWISSLVTSAVASLFFSALAAWSHIAGHVLAFVLFTSSLAMFHFIHSIRIVRKVRICRR